MKYRTRNNRFALISLGPIMVVWAALASSLGDIRDAHKDMTLATLGSFIAIIVTAIISASRNRDFACIGPTVSASNAPSRSAHSKSNA